MDNQDPALAMSTTTSDTANTAPPGIQGCRWCGMYHAQRCPFVAAIEYHEDGSVKRVEFVGAGIDSGRLRPNPVDEWKRPHAPACSIFMPYGFCDCGAAS